jgi:hypothetical protein
MSLAPSDGQTPMTTSQCLMFAALGCIAITWIASWMTGHRAPALQLIFAALCVQALAAILLSFPLGVSLCPSCLPQ